MRLFVSWVVAAATFGCATLSLPKQLVMDDVKFVVREFRMKNGMRIIFEEDHATDKVAVIAIVGAGSAADPVGKEGLAHYIEHLSYRARPNPKFTTTQLLDFSGVALNNAETGLDTTTYYALGPREALPALISITAAQLTRPLAGLTPDVLEVERAVVQNELRFNGETRVSGQLGAWIQRAAFPEGHPYARPSTIASIGGLTLADAEQFVAAHYRPEQMTLEIIGDFDVTKVDALLSAFPAELVEGAVPEETFFRGRIKTGAGIAVRSPKGPLETQKSIALEEPALHIVWTLPSTWTDEEAHQALLPHLVEFGLDRKKLDDDIAYASAELAPFANATVLLLTVGLRKATHPQQTLDAVLRRLEDTWKLPLRGFSAQGAQAVIGMAFSATNILVRGQDRATVAHHLGDLAMYGRRADVRRQEGAFARALGQAGSHLTQARARALLLVPMPESERPALTATGVGTRFAQDTSGPVDYPAVEIERLARQSALASAHRFALENGLEALIVRRPLTHVVAVSLGLPGGSRDATPVGTAEVCDIMAYAKKAERGHPSSFGGSALEAITDHATVLSYRGAAGNVANLLAMMAERVDSMTLPFVTGEVLDMARTSPALAKAAEIEQRPANKVARRIRTLLYPGHRYGETASSSMLHTLDADALQRWLDAVYQPNRARLVIVGDVDPVQTEALVRTWFGGWNRGDVPPALPLPPLPAHPGAEVGDRPGATQTSLGLACRLPDGVGKQWVANRVLSALLQQRVEDLLRQKLGASYGVTSHLADGTGGRGTLRLLTAVAVEDQGRVLEQLRAAWTGLGADGWDLGEIDRARWAVARTASTWSNTPVRLADTVVFAWLEGADPKELAGFSKTLAAINDGDIEDAWKVCAATTMLSVVGDRAAISSQLVKTGWVKGIAR